MTPFTLSFSVFRSLSLSLLVCNCNHRWWKKLHIKIPCNVCGGSFRNSWKHRKIGVYHLRIYHLMAVTDHNKYSLEDYLVACFRRFHSIFLSLFRQSHNYRMYLHSLENHIIVIVVGCELPSIVAIVHWNLYGFRCATKHHWHWKASNNFTDRFRKGF